MKAGIFFNIFMSFVWAGAAYCAPGDSKLIYHDFPKTMKDVSFIDMLELKTKGYEPWFDKKVYTGITLEKKTAVAAGTAGEDEGTDYCMAEVGCNIGAKFSGTSIMKTVIAGINTGVKCEDDKQDVDLLDVKHNCVHYCELDDVKKNFSGELCFYANVDGGIEHTSLPKVLILHAEGYDIYFSGVNIEVDNNETVECGDKLGKIADKGKFFYCVESNSPN